MARRWKSTDLYPEGASFEDLLEWHLTVWGTNPKANRSKADRPWVLRNFAAAIFGEPRGKDENAPERNLRNWRNGVYCPDPKEEPRIFEILFGDNPELSVWKGDLQGALDRKRQEKAARTEGVKTVVPVLAKPSPIPMKAPEFSERGNNLGPPPNGASAHHDRLAAEVQKISQDVDKILLMLRGSDIFERASEAGLGKNEIAKALEGLGDATNCDEAKAEELVLLHLLKSNFTYQQEFAWDSLLYSNKISSVAVQAMVAKALSYDEQYQAAALQDILQSCAEGIDKIAIAESLASHRNEDVRKVAIDLLLKHDDKAGLYAPRALADRSGPIRLVGAQYFERKLSSAPEIVPEFCRLLVDSNPSVRKLVARGLLGLCINKGWDHLPADCLANLTAALAEDREIWTTVVPALANDQVPIKAFQSLLPTISSETDRNVRRRILNTVPGERERYIAEEIRHLSSSDDLRIIQAAYRLADIKCIGDAGISALMEAEQRTTSVSVRSAISMAIKSQDGRDIPRVCELASDDVDQSDVYPLWKSVVIVENRRGIDIPEALKIVSHCKKFEADFYIWHGEFSPNRVLVCADSALDICMLCLGKGSEMSIGAAGPEAIEGVNSLALYVSTSLC